MSPVPPELTRELILSLQEQLVQKDAQIATLASLLKDANERLTHQQQLWESFLVSQVETPSPPLRATTPLEPAATLERPSLPDDDLRMADMQAEEAGLVMETAAAPAVVSSELERTVEPERPPQEAPASDPTRPPIPMSYFGAPLAGMAHAVTAAAKDRNKEEEEDDGEGVAFPQPLQQSVPGKQTSRVPFHKQRFSASQAEESEQEITASPRIPLLALLAAVVIIAIVGGGLWWWTVHAAQARAKQSHYPVQQKTADKAPLPQPPPLASTPEISAASQSQANKLPEDSALPAERSKRESGQKITKVANSPPETNKPAAGDLPTLDSALVRAVANADLPRVKKLLALGAEVNSRNHQGATVLMMAARQGNLSLTEALLAQGADINAVNNGGWNALMLAIHYKHRTTARALLQHAARVNDRNLTGTTALMLAAQQGNRDLITRLLAKGANAASKNNAGQTAVDIATHAGKTEIIPLLQTSESPH